MIGRKVQHILDVIVVDAAACLKYSDGSLHYLLGRIVVIVLAKQHIIVGHHNVVVSSSYEHTPHWLLA
jgi:hypothetical protein